MQKGETAAGAICGCRSVGSKQWGQQETGVASKRKHSPRPQRGPGLLQLENSLET